VWYCSASVVLFCQCGIVPPVWYCSASVVNMFSFVLCGLVIWEKWINMWKAFRKGNVLRFERCSRRAR
jgi:hypothetical protein